MMAGALANAVVENDVKMTIINAKDKMRFFKATNPQLISPEIL